MPMPSSTLPAKVCAFAIAEIKSHLACWLYAKQKSLYLRVMDFVSLVFGYYFLGGGDIKSKWVELDRLSMNGHE